MAAHYFYYNLHRGDWSRRVRGIVESHETEATLYWVDFKVGARGREKVIREGRKNVHAFAAAERWRPGPPLSDSALCSMREVTYNPFKHETFVFVDTGEACYGAVLAHLTADRKVFVIGGRKVANAQIAHTRA